MQHTIRGSDVFVKEDLRSIIDALDIAARHQPTGCWREGWMAATAAMRTAVGIPVEQPEVVTITERYERIEERRERTVERYRTPSANPIHMTGDDVNITLFDPAQGRLVEREIGYGWIGNNGHTAFWDASDWQQVSAVEANAWGQLVPVEPQPWLVLVRHAYADRMRRQLAVPANRSLLR